MFYRQPCFLGLVNGSLHYWCCILLSWIPGLKLLFSENTSFSFSQFIYRHRAGQCDEFTGLAYLLMWYLNWVPKGDPRAWFMVMAHAQGPLSGYLCALLFLKLHFSLLFKYLFHSVRRAKPNWFIVPLLLIESFSFVSKGNQERAIEQIIKIKGICSLMNYSLL